MFGKKERSYGEEILPTIEQAMKELSDSRRSYDEETDKQLAEIKNSDWPVERYLREILYELRYARREKERPKW